MVTDVTLGTHQKSAQHIHEQSPETFESASRISGGSPDSYDANELHLLLKSAHHARGDIPRSSGEEIDKGAGWGEYFETPLLGDTSVLAVVGVGTLRS